MADVIGRSTRGSWLLYQGIPPVRRRGHRGELSSIEGCTNVAGIFYGIADGIDDGANSSTLDGSFDGSIESCTDVDVIADEYT